MLIGYTQKHKNVPKFNRFDVHLILCACILTSHLNVIKILNTLLSTLFIVRLLCVILTK